MNSEFVRDGVRYSLVVSGVGLRELERRAEQLKPDQSLWTSAQKRRSGVNGRANQYAANIPDDPIRPVRQKRDKFHYGEYRRPRPEEFTDRVEYR